MSFTNNKNHYKSKIKSVLKRSLLLFLFLSIIYLIKGVGDIFGFFKEYDVHLCPPVKGQLFYQGKPLAGEKVIRYLSYVDYKDRFDHTFTDKEGRFSLPEVNIRSKLPGNFLVEHNTLQIIYIEQNKEKYTLWNSSLVGYEPKAAYTRKLSSLNCDLTSPRVSFEFANDTHPQRPHYAGTICQWEDDFSIYHVHENNE
mgnify:FL=1